jgi:hypothetical protein
VRYASRLRKCRQEFMRLSVNGSSPTTSRGRGSTRELLIAFRLPWTSSLPTAPVNNPNNRWPDEGLMDRMGQEQSKTVERISKSMNPSRHRARRLDVSPHQQRSHSACRHGSIP